MKGTSILLVAHYQSKPKDKFMHAITKAMGISFANACVDKQGWQKLDSLRVMTAGLEAGGFSHEDVVAWLELGQVLASPPEAQKWATDKGWLQPMPKRTRAKSNLDTATLAIQAAMDASTQSV